MRKIGKERKEEVGQVGDGNRGKREEEKKGATRGEERMKRGGEGRG